MLITGEGSGLGGRHRKGVCVVIQATGGGEEHGGGGAASRGGCGGGPPRGLGATGEVRACGDSVCTGTWWGGGRVGSTDPGCISRLIADGRIRLSGCFTGGGGGRFWAVVPCTCVSCGVNCGSITVGGRFRFLHEGDIS